MNILPRLTNKSPKLESKSNLSENIGWFVIFYAFFPDVIKSKPYIAVFLSKYINLKKIHRKKRNFT